MQRANLPMWQFNKNCSFSSVDLTVVFRERPKVLQRTLKTVMELLADGALSVPQPLKVFKVSNIDEPFKLLQSGKSFGKMIVEMGEEKEVVTARLIQRPKHRFHPDRSYVLSGGLGGLGRSLALWMSRRGARNLILLSRSGPQSPKAIELQTNLSSAGVRVKILSCDIGDKEMLSAALASCQAVLPPIAGCIQAAMVLKDSILANMSFDDWNTACRSKISGTWNLHTLLPPRMEFFVCLSSLSCIIGNGGQANYAAGNTFQDSFAQYRVARGERATSINLGWVQSEGAVAEDARLQSIFAKTDIMCPIAAPTVHALVDYGCDPDLAPTAQIITGLRFPGVEMVEDALQNIPWLRRPTFKHLVQPAVFLQRRGGANGAGETTDFAALFRHASSFDDAAQIVVRSLQYRLSKAFSIASEDVDVTGPLHASGVDSLLGIELRNHLAKNFHSDVAVFDIMGAKSIEAASELVTKRSTIRFQ